MAQLWQGDISECTISRALKKIGFMQKKRFTATKNAMSRNRKPSFIKQLANQAEETIFGIADARYESTFRLNLQNSRSSEFIAMGKF